MKFLNTHILFVLFIVLVVPAASLCAAEQFHPQSLSSSATVTQSALEKALYNVTVNDAEKMMTDALIAAGTAPDIKVTLIADRSRALNQSTSPIQTTIDNLQFDHKSGNWNAQLLFDSNTANARSLAVRGRYTEMVNIPTLIKTISAGVKIEAADVQMTSYDSKRLNKSIVLKSEDLIGKAPKHGISSGIAIRQEELSIAADIAKGAQVTLKYANKGMLINTTGETLEPGVLGNRVRVKNTVSKAVVTGTLEDGAVVSITPSNL